MSIEHPQDQQQSDRDCPGAVLIDKTIREQPGERHEQCKQGQSEAADKWFNLENIAHVNR